MRASSKWTLCFCTFIRALFSSHSNIRFILACPQRVDYRVPTTFARPRSHNQRVHEKHVARGNGLERLFGEPSSCAGGDINPAEGLEATAVALPGLLDHPADHVIAEFLSLLSVQRQ